MEASDSFPCPSWARCSPTRRPGAARASRWGWTPAPGGFARSASRAAQRAYKAQLVFIACDTDVLHRRFSDTRRAGTLARTAPVREGIAAEALALDRCAAADLVVDTTELSVHDLRHILEGHFGPRGGDMLAATLMSFGFRNGPPREADIVLDGAFDQPALDLQALRRKTGRDPEVAAYDRGRPGS